MPDCCHLDCSAYKAAFDLLPPGSSIADLERVHREHRPVRCTASATHRVEMYADDPNDDSEVHLCAEHLSADGWSEDDHTAIFGL